jgi:heme/copper-type cytochrome/quinol oxidase subunit 2
MDKIKGYSEMEKKSKKKGFNFVAFFLSLLVVGSVIGPFAWQAIDSRPDYTVIKKKITRADLADFRKKTEHMVLSYTVRHEGDMPIVHPPADSDIYLLGRNYTWGKYILELEQGKPYRLHLASLDMPHALIVHELKLMNRIRVGQFTTVLFSPGKAGRFKLLCGDFCGTGHYGMVGTLIVASSQTEALNK